MPKKGRAAHGEVKPSKYKTSMCQYFVAGTDCPYAPHCAFAHGPEELRTEDENLSLLAAQAAQELPKLSEPPSPTNVSLGLSHSSTPQRRLAVSPPLPLLGDEDIAAFESSHRPTMSSAGAASIFQQGNTKNMQLNLQEDPELQRGSPLRAKVPNPVDEASDGGNSLLTNRQPHYATVSSVWSFHSLEYSAQQQQQQQQQEAAFWGAVGKK